MEAFARRPSTVAARGSRVGRRRTALPFATLRGRTGPVTGCRATLPALLLAAVAALVAVVAAPAAQAVTSASVVAGTPGPKGSSTGTPPTAAAGTTQRGARATRATRAARFVAAPVPVSPTVAPSAGTGPDGAHQPLLPSAALPPHTAAPAPPVTPLLRDTPAVLPPTGRPLLVAPGRSPPSDPRRA